MDDVENAFDEANEIFRGMRRRIATDLWRNMKKSGKNEVKEELRGRNADEEAQNKKLYFHFSKFLKETTFNFEAN